MQVDTFSVAIIFQSPPIVHADLILGNMLLTISPFSDKPYFLITTVRLKITTGGSNFLILSATKKPQIRKRGFIMMNLFADSFSRPPPKKNTDHERLSRTRSLILGRKRELQTRNKQTYVRTSVKCRWDERLIKTEAERTEKCVYLQQDKKNT